MTYMKDIWKRFALLGQTFLGYGQSTVDSHSVVRRCIHRDSGQEYAVKIMDVADQESQTAGDLRDEDGLSLREQGFGIPFLVLL